MVQPPASAVDISWPQHRRLVATMTRRAPSVIRTRHPGRKIEPAALRRPLVARRARSHCRYRVPGRLSVHPRHPARPCTADGCGRCGSTRGSGRPQESNQRYRYLLAQGVSGLSVAFDLPTQMGYDSDHALAAGEVGRVGVAIDSIDDMAELFDGIPLDRVSTSMTINATAIILLALYLAVARRQGVAPSGAFRHDPERHPEGIRRARHLHLPAARVAPDRDRHLRVLRARAAELEHDLDQRLPHPRGGIDGGPGGRVHVRERDRVRPGGASTPGSTSTASASGSRSSSTRTTISSRRSRSSAPRGGCGRGSCATGSARPTRARSSCASTPRRPAAR